MKEKEGGGLGRRKGKRKEEGGGELDKVETKLVVNLTGRR